MSYPDQAGLLDRLAAYPLSARCFSSYVRRITPTVRNGWEDYDMIRVLAEGDDARLRSIESRLNESRTILGLEEENFSRVFGFTDDLLSDDPEKVHDILAEPLFVIDLFRHGFSSISKLPPSIRTATKKLPNADFLASFGSSKFAIELKTIRTENKPKPELGRFLGDGTKPDWWGQMFRNNAITKIEGKDRRVLAQLANARDHYQCAKTMLVLYTRRLGPSTMMTKQDYVAQLEELLGRYPEVSHMASKDFFGEVTFVPPP